MRWALRRPRPALFVKGGDYAGKNVLERAVMAELGGVMVTAPMVGQNSTTRIIQRVPST